MEKIEILNELSYNDSSLFTFCFSLFILSIEIDEKFPFFHAVLNCTKQVILRK